MRTCVAFVFVVVVAVLDFAESSEFKNAVIEGSKRECMIAQRRAKENERLSNEVLTKYCNCIGDHLFHALSPEEFARTAETPMPPSIQRKLNALGQACFGELLK